MWSNMAGDEFVFVGASDHYAQALAALEAWSLAPQTAPFRPGSTPRSRPGRTVLRGGQATRGHDRFGRSVPLHFTVTA